MKLLNTIVPLLLLFGGTGQAQTTPAPRQHPLVVGAFQVGLKGRITEQGLTVSLHPERLTGKDQPVEGPFMSRPIQLAAAQLGSINKRVRKPISVPFTLTVRDLEGTFIDQLGWVAQIKRPAVEHKLNIDILFGDNTHSTKGLMLNHDFSEFLKAMIPPLENIRLTVPDNPYFILELHYDLPYSGYHKTRRGTGYSAAVLLGTAYCEQVGETLHTYSNINTRKFEQARSVMERVAIANKNGDLLAAEEGMLHHMEQIPSSRIVAGLLLEYYRRTNLEKAWAFASYYQPFFSHWFFRDPYRGPFYNDDSGMRKKRRSFSAEPDAFPLNKNAWLSIMSPISGDMVSGTTRVSFAVRQDEDNLILSALCFVDGKQVKEIEEPPTWFDVNLNGNGNRVLRVVAFFMDGTRVEDSINIQSITTNESASVTVGEIQVVALDKKGWPAEFDSEQLSMSRKGTPIQVVRVWRDDQPLDVVILADTSYSMKNLMYQAQFAIYGLLEKMKPQEAASVYSFDEKVTLVKRFENNLDEAAPGVFSMVPMGHTALNDALLVARCKLMSRPKSTKAIIVLGDGVDTASVTQDEELMAIFEGTPIRVYAIQANRGGRGRSSNFVDVKMLVTRNKDARRAESVLNQLAIKTGGLFYRLEEDEHPEKVLERILAELRNLYFVSYNNSGIPVDDKIKVKIPNKKVRSLHVYRN